MTEFGNFNHACTINIKMGQTLDKLLKADVGAILADLKNK
jgi:hypothetical protein